jgi:hypothetical protein
MMMALNPRVIIRSLANGIATTLSPFVLTGLRISSHRKKTNNTKARLQINVNLDKKFNKRIDKAGLVSKILKIIQN